MSGRRLRSIALATLAAALLAAFAIFGLAPGPARVQVSKSGFQARASKDFDLQSDTKIAVESRRGGSKRIRELG